MCSVSSGVKKNEIGAALILFHLSQTVSFQKTIYFTWEHLKTYDMCTDRRLHIKINIKSRYRARIVERVKVESVGVLSKTHIGNMAPECLNGIPDPPSETIPLHFQF